MNDPAVIAKVLGWEKYMFPINPFDKDGPHFWGWVDKDGNGKARASTPKGWTPHWNPYESDADALLAALEFAKLYDGHGFIDIVMDGDGVSVSIVRDYATVVDRHRRYEMAGGYGSFRQAITTALERWGDEADLS